MALTTQIQAACLLLLLITSMTGSTVFQPQTGQSAELQPQHTSEAKPNLKSLVHRLGRRDTHFPICVFCCGCCNNSKCGICCKT